MSEVVQGNFNGGAYGGGSPKMVASFPLNLEKEQRIELPFFEDNEKRPFPIGIFVAGVSGERDLIQHSGVHAVLKVVMPFERSDKIVAVDLFCIKDGEEIPENTILLGTVLINGVFYHYFS